MFNFRLKRLLKIAQTGSAESWREVIDAVNSKDLGEAGQKIAENSGKLTTSLAKIKESVDSIKGMSDEDKKALMDVMSESNPGSELTSESNLQSGRYISKRAGILSSLWNVGKGVFKTIFSPVVMGIYTAYELYENYKEYTSINEELHKEYADIIDVSSFYFNADEIKKLINKHSEDPILLKKVAKLNNVCESYDANVIGTIINILFELDMLLQAFIMFDSAGLSSLIKSLFTVVTSILGLANIAIFVDSFTNTIMPKILAGFEDNKKYIINIANKHLASLKTMESNPMTTDEDWE